jgi:DNA-binding NarL/FixJ family response regulator
LSSAIRRSQHSKIEVMQETRGVSYQGSLRVLIADDHEMLLQLFELYLKETASMEVATATTLDGALELMREDGPFDLVLLDLNMPGMNGVAGLRKAIQLAGEVPVAILTSGPSPRMLDEIMDCGAAGIVLKTTPVQSLPNAIRFMHSGEKYLPLALMRPQAQPAPATANGPLSAREMAVLTHLADGKQNKGIARELGLAEATVKMHVAAVCRKLGARNRTQAVVLARDLGLV